MEKRLRTSLIVPVLVCLFALAPGISQSFIWLDARVFDAFFAIEGLPAPEHQVAIIEKDQGTIDLLGQDPDRGQMAMVLEKLAQAKVKVAVLDYIYDQAKDPVMDARFTKALKNVPGAVLAERFRIQSAFSSGFATISLARTADQRSPPTLSLCEGIAGGAADRGLVNVATDFDNVVRTLPLAFLPAEGTEYAPSLSLAAYIQSRLPETIDLSRFSPAPNPESDDFATAATRWLLDATQKGTRNFTGVGDSRLDQIFRRRELLWLARNAAPDLASSTPETTKAWEEAARTVPYASLPQQTWLQMPGQPIPLVKTYLNPYLRMPFSKLSGALQGDGIPAYSMALFLRNTSAAANATIEVETIGSDPADQPLQQLYFDITGEGTHSISGQCLEISGQPLKDVQAIAFQDGEGFWATATSDLSGKFTFSGLPPGTYSIELSRRTKDARLSLTLEKPVFCNVPEVTLPPAHFLPQEMTLSGSVAPATAERCLSLEADGLWVTESGPNGELPFTTIPAGLTLNGFDGGEPPVWGSNPAQLLASSGKPLPKTRIALLEEPSCWKTEMQAAKILPARATTFTLEGLSPSLGARIALCSPNGSATVRPAEFDLVLGTPPTLAAPPPEMTREFRPVSVSWKMATENHPAGRVWILTNDGNWVDAGAGKNGKVLLPPGRNRVFWASGKSRGTYNHLKSLVTGKAIFLGTSLLEDQDFYSTPANFMEASFKHVPGVHLHAGLFSALQRQEFFWPLFLHPDRSPDTWSIWLLLALFPLLLFLDELFHRFGAIKAGAVTLGVMLGWLVLSRQLFLWHILLPCALPVFNLGLFGALRGYQAYSLERAQKMKTKATFGRFVSARMVEEIMKNPEALKPGGDKKPLTVMFTDLAGFTSISEALNPEELVLLMNEYLGAMTLTLFEYGGTLDKYIGDAVMAFWNHPAPQPDHAVRACLCAIAMQEKLKILQKKWVKQGLPFVSMRAGINTAECVVGFMGSDIQMNFTCMGDGVNLASRMEGANKAYHTIMMIAESTQKHLAETNIRTRFLDFLAVKGKAIPMKTYELIGLKGNDDAIWDKALPIYDRGIQLYLARNWDEAEKTFREVFQYLPEDGLSSTYIERCTAYRVNPPEANWDGSYSLKTK